MPCGGNFSRKAGRTFGLRTSGGQNLWSCTGLIVASGQNPGEDRLSFDELRAGHSWVVQPGTTYTIFLNVQSKVPAQQVSVDVEIPLNSAPQTCSRLSSGVAGVWRVVAT